MSVSLLVSTEWLAAHLDDPDLRVVDVRWYLLPPKNGRDEYARAHIPNAAFVDISDDLASPVDAGPGRHPLPSVERFAAAMSRAGVDENTYVIAYDDSGGATAARLWWLLRYFGHDRVSLLDGGINKWIAEGRALQIEIPNLARANFIPHSPRTERVVNKQNVIAAQNDPRALILDSRVAERYEGKTEPVDPRAGHIPRAQNAPLAGNLNADMTFRSADELRARFASLGANESEHIIVYCGSGVNACQNIFALALAGFDHALLYEGSWSDWSRDPNLPAEVGNRKMENG